MYHTIDTTAPAAVAAAVAHLLGQLSDRELGDGRHEPCSLTRLRHRYHVQRATRLATVLHKDRAHLACIFSVVMAIIIIIIIGERFIELDHVGPHDTTRTRCSSIVKQRQTLDRLQRSSIERQGSRTTDDQQLGQLACGLSSIDLRDGQHGSDLDVELDDIPSSSSSGIISHMQHPNHTPIDDVPS